MNETNTSPVSLVVRGLAKLSQEEEKKVTGRTRSALVAVLLLCREGRRRFLIDAVLYVECTRRLPMEPFYLFPRSTTCQATITQQNIRSRTAPGLYTRRRAFVGWLNNHFNCWSCILLDTSIFSVLICRPALPLTQDEYSELQCHQLLYSTVSAQLLLSRSEGATAHELFPAHN